MIANAVCPPWRLLSRQGLHRQVRRRADPTEDQKATVPAGMHYPGNDVSRVRHQTASAVGPRNMQGRGVQCQPDHRGEQRLESPRFAQWPGYLTGMRSLSTATTEMPRCRLMTVSETSEEKKRHQAAMGAGTAISWQSGSSAASSIANATSPCLKNPRQGGVRFPQRFGRILDQRTCAGGLEAAASDHRVASVL